MIPWIVHEQGTTEKLTSEEAVSYVKAGAAPSTFAQPERERRPWNLDIYRERPSSQCSQATFSENVHELDHSNCPRRRSLGFLSCVSVATMADFSTEPPSPSDVH